MKLPLPRRLDRYVTRAERAVQSERIAYTRAQPIQHDTVLYESFAGNGMLGNPEAIFRHLLGRRDCDHLWHVWALSDEAAIARFQEEFAAHPRVRFVRRDGFAYWKALSSAGYLINNATFPPAFGKRAGQVYLNTWHGTPLKLMGFDMPGGAMESANTLRNLLTADYLLAANPFMAQTMYEDAYRLRNVYQGQIIEEGYPRIDRQRLSPADVAQVRALLHRDGIVVGDRDVVLLKTHQVVHALAQARPALRRILVPNTIPANVLLGAAAALVTDYSSIFFDYLATGRPIVFFTPDADRYADERGTYLPLAELPGPVCTDPGDTGRRLAAALCGDMPAHPRYREWADRFTPYEDGGATARVVDVVFRGVTAGMRVRPARNDGRIRLLLYLGGMRSNGITTSVLNLLNAIDHDRYDVTALMARFHARDPRSNQARIHPAVRQVFRIGGMNGSKAAQLRRRARNWRGRPPAPREERWHARLWDAEWTRVFGSARFDWVADFSGYSPVWTNLLLHSPYSSRAVWLHNEMASDRLRTVGGRQPMRRALGLVFSLYHAFDALVSVSPSLTELNRAALAPYAPAGRFHTVRNLPNVPRVVAGMREPLSALLPPADEDGVPPEVPEWMDRLQRRDAGTSWFVTVGRLSTEKNHARLIRAFAQVHAVRPETRLAVVGRGPLHAALERQIAEAGLDGVAFLTGAHGNPFAIMAACDCFVLSSSYEGQPMVLMEAALCGLPIVSTAFRSVRDALPEDGIRVVAQDDDALRDGMLAFLDGGVPAAHLDASAYTADVMREFDTLVADSIRAAKTGPISVVRDLGGIPGLDDAAPAGG